MTIGIYSLVFKGTSKVYIGKSIKIERRFLDHKHNLSHGTAASKLQIGYDTFGMPTLEILCSCEETELDVFETETIEIYDSVANGFNTSPGGIGGGGTASGEANGRSLYSNAKKIEILLLLANRPELTQKEVAEITNVGLSTVEHISAGNTGKWMEEAYPMEYAKVVSLRNNGDNALKLSNANSAKAQGKEYPKIQDPLGNTYTVSNIRAFGREHNLNNGDLCQVMNGRKASVKGWKLTKDSNVG